MSVGGGRATDEHLAIAPPIDACIVLSLARFKNLSKQLFAILSVGGALCATTTTIKNIESLWQGKKIYVSNHRWSYLKYHYSVANFLCSNLIILHSEVVRIIKNTSNIVLVPSCTS